MEVNDQLQAAAALPLGKEHSFGRKEGGWAPEAVWTVVKRNSSPSLGPRLIGHCPVTDSFTDADKK